jgi:hypothetical protein
VRYEVLLYDLTSTYFESDVPDDEADPRRFGYSRDKRGDCVQVVVALVVTPEGLPLAYEMFPGNTADKTTLRGMLATKRVHRVLFEDTEDAKDTDAVCVPRIEDIEAAIQFAEETAPGGLLVHCQMGWSRSTAIALVLLVKKLWPAPDAVDLACAALLEVRASARPNNLIVRLGFGLFMPEEQARIWSKRVAEHPVFLSNRTATSNHLRQKP